MKTSFLEKILAQKQTELRRHRARLKEEDLRHMIRGVPAARPLAEALQEISSPAIIAEIKKASPSQGVLREEFRAEEIAAEYAAAGAAAISVLTDEKFFMGSLQDLRRVHSRVELPVLRKDFIISPYQVLEARAFGADAVLLIAAALGEDELPRLLEQTHVLGMQALVEVHNEAELERVLRTDARLVGINNRDLFTFEVDLATTERLAGRARQENRVVVAESGIHSAEDLLRMKQAGAHAVLIGSHFMRQLHPGKALQKLREDFARAAGEDLRHHAA